MVDAVQEALSLWEEHERTRAEILAVTDRFFMFARHPPLDLVKNF